MNHDLVLEQVFGDAQIPLTDGFEDPDGDVRFFKPELYRQQATSKLFKLHGSANWHQYALRDAPAPESNPRLGAAINHDHLHCKDRNGRCFRCHGMIPNFLTGTFSKTSLYASEPFATIHSWFERALLGHRLLISSGYGWKDVGINEMVLNWLSGLERRRMIILEGCGTKGREIASGLNYPKGSIFADLIRQERIRIVPKFLCGIRAEELLDEIGRISS